MSVKSAFRPVIVYLRDNPGVVSLIVGEAAILAAKAGVHVTEDQLATVAALLMPLLLAYFHVARKASHKAKVRATDMGGTVSNTTVGGHVAHTRSQEPRAFGFSK